MLTRDQTVWRERYGGWGPPVVDWPRAVWGDVLEIGLGEGRCAALIERNDRVTSHTIVEQNTSFKGNEPPGVTVIWGTFPMAGLGTYDCITLDLTVTRAQLTFAATLLKDGGALFVRKYPV